MAFTIADNVFPDALGVGGCIGVVFVRGFGALSHY